jgi:sugar phosphate isomerase/epimerase
LILSVNAYGVRRELACGSCLPFMDWLEGIGATGLEPMMALAETQEDVRDQWVRSLTRCREIMDAYQGKLEVPSAHLWPYINRELATPDLMADYISRYYEISGIEEYVASRAALAAEDARTFGRFLAETNRRLEDVPARLSYHPHNNELHAMDGGIRQIDLIRVEAGEGFLLQYDVGWGWFSGADEIALAEEFAEDITMLHLKDFSAQAYTFRGRSRKELPVSAFAPVGAGVVRNADFVRMAQEGRFPPVEWGHRPRPGCKRIWHPRRYQTRSGECLQDGRCRFRERRGVEDAVQGTAARRKVWKTGLLCP